MTASIQDARIDLGERLRACREEMEDAVAVRVWGIAPPRETTDPEYLQGLRSSLVVAIDYALEAIEQGEPRAQDAPAALLVQARTAARTGVALDTVLRRYLAGYSLLMDYVLRVAGEGEPSGGPALQQVLHGFSAVFDRLLEAVSEEHRRASARVVRSPRQRRADRIRRLLAGEPIARTGLDYHFDGFHLATIGAGPGASAAIRALASEFEQSLLLVSVGSDEFWAWFGSRGKHNPRDVVSFVNRAADMVDADTTLSLGEPGEGESGWRISHRQAAAVRRLTRGRTDRVTRYADVALLCTVENDQLLCQSLRQTYLAPLSEEADGGAAIRETLRTYLAAKRNVSSTAVLLKVNRQTVRNRLRTFEEKIGKPLAACTAEFEMALELDESTNPPGVPIRTPHTDD